MANSMGVIRASAGYFLLLISAGAFLIARTVLVPFVDSGGDVVRTLSYGISFTIFAALAGFVGVWMLVADRYLVVVLSIVILLAAAPSLFGSILDISDYLSASGYNGFGSIIMIMIGNYVLPVGAAVVVAIGLGRAIQTLRSSGRSQTSQMWLSP